MLWFHSLWWCVTLRSKPNHQKNKHHKSYYHSKSHSLLVFFKLLVINLFRKQVKHLFVGIEAQPVEQILDFALALILDELYCFLFGYFDDFDLFVVLQIPDDGQLRLVQFDGHQHTDTIDFEESH